MYGKLNANFHQYNESYVIGDVNFSKTQRVILRWLTPDVDLEKKDVVWENEIYRRDL